MQTLASILVLCCAGLSFLPSLQAQPITDPQGDVGIGTIAPHPSALLDLVSSSKGFLVSRITTVQRDAIVRPATGLMIYNLVDSAIQVNCGDEVQPIWCPIVMGIPGGGLSAHLSPGAIWYGSPDSTAIELPIGPTGTLLTSNGNEPVWIINPGGLLPPGTAPHTTIAWDPTANSGAGAWVENAHLTSDPANGNTTVNGSSVIIPNVPNVNSGTTVVITDGAGSIQTINLNDLIGNATLSEDALWVGNSANNPTELAGGTSGQLLTIDGSGAPSWADPTFWSIIGNSGTIDATNFLGTIDNVPVNIRVNNQRAFRIEPGIIPNIIGGHSSNSVAAGLLSATIAGGGGPGFPNRITGAGNTGVIGGGNNNTVSGLGGVVSGGEGNQASGRHAVISGGERNRATDQTTVIGGGEENTASANHTTIGGGELNQATAPHSVVSGGQRNNVGGTFSVISGGLTNVITSPLRFASIGGGTSNTASANGTTIAGGIANRASAIQATISGGTNNSASGGSSTIGGGSGNTVSGSGATISGGISNTTSAQNGTISGGGGNRAGFYSTVGGGQTNLASGHHATIAGGRENQAIGSWTTVGGGVNNIATGVYTTISGGSGNSVASSGASIVGGQDNLIAGGGGFSTILGGFGLTLSGTRSIGYNANDGIGTSPMSISAARTAIFGSVDLWLANNLNRASQLRFYEANSTVGAFPPVGINYSAFVQNDPLTSNITYDLPSSLNSTALNQQRFMRATTTTLNSAAQLDWVDAVTLVGQAGWLLTGNSGTNPATSFIGTRDAQPLLIRTNNVERVRLGANGLVGINEMNPQHRLHAVNSATTDEFAALYGEVDQGTTNQSIGVWGDASNSGVTNTGTIGVLATGNGNTTTGQTNVALQVNDGELTMGRTTTPPGAGSVVEGGAVGTTYSAEGPSGVIELTLGGGDLTTVAPITGLFQDLGTVTINNRYVTSESIVQVNVLSKIDEGTAPNPEDGIYIVDVDNRAAGTFVIRIGIIPTTTNLTNFQNTDAVRIGYSVINPSR